MQCWILGACLGVLLASGAHAQAGEVVPPAALETPPVAYPEGALGQAEVVLVVEVAEDGSVARIDLQSGDEPFAGAARLGVKHWRFSPATRGGLPVRARILVRIAFTPPRAPEPETRPTASPSEPAPEQGAPPAPRSEEPVIEVLVTGEQREELGSIYVPRQEARLIPGAFADPFRVIEVMPGVAPILSGIPYFFVRGAPPGAVGYLLDGIRVPLLFHLGAGPSVIAPALIERVDLFASAYPAAYGGYAGAIMAGQTSAPGDVARGEMQARVFDAGAFIEVPFAGARGSAAVGARYSYTQALLALVAPDFRLHYWDYQARVSYRSGDHDRLSLFAFGALDQLEKERQAAPLFDTGFQRLDLRWDHETDAGHTRTGLTLGLDRVAAAEEDEPEFGAQRDSRSLTAYIRTDQRVSRGVRVRAGAELGLEDVERERDLAGPRTVDYGARLDHHATAHADLVYRPAFGVELVPGMRVERARSRGEGHWFWEPRLATNVRLGHGLRWVSAFGIANQLPSAAVRVPGRSPNALELNEQEAWQAAESIESLLPLRTIGRLTLFHTWTDASSLSSRNYGVELFLRRDFSERLGGFLSYTLSWARGSAFQEDFWTAYDRRHVISAVLGYDFGAGFRLGVRAYYNSGRPFVIGCPTPGCGPGDPMGGPVVDVVRGRYPGFFRADFRFEKRWELQAGQWIAATFEWFNATVAGESDRLRWDPRAGGVQFISRDPLTLPSIGIEAGF